MMQIVVDASTTDEVGYFVCPAKRNPTVLSIVVIRTAKNDDLLGEWCRGRNREKKNSLSCVASSRDNYTTQKTLSLSSKDQSQNQSKNSVAIDLLTQLVDNVLTWRSHWGHLEWKSGYYVSVKKKGKICILYHIWFWFRVLFVTKGQQLRKDDGYPGFMCEIRMLAQWGCGFTIGESSILPFLIIYVQLQRKPLLISGSISQLLHLLQIEWMDM